MYALHIHGDINQYRAGPPFGSYFKSLLKYFGNIIRVFYLETSLCNWCCHRYNICFLKTQLPDISVSGTRLPPEAANLKPDASDSFETLRQSARNGDVPSQFKLGAKYASGEGTPLDHTKAAYWFQRAAMSGYVPAQGILGAYYWVGRGVPKDLKEAYFWSILARSGNDEISKQRVDVLAARLSQDDMLEVQKRIRDWSRKHEGSSTGTGR